MGIRKPCSVCTQPQVLQPLARHCVSLRLSMPVANRKVHYLCLEPVDSDTSMQRLPHKDPREGSCVLFICTLTLRLRESISSDFTDSRAIKISILLVHMICTVLQLYSGAAGPKVYTYKRFQVFSLTIHNVSPTPYVDDSRRELAGSTYCWCREAHRLQSAIHAKCSRPRFVMRAAQRLLQVPTLVQGRTEAR